MLNKTYLLIIFVFLTLACQQKQSQTEPSLVFTSIPPLQYLIESIAGDSLQVECLVPEGMAPEIFEPNAQQMNKLYQARLIVCTGLLGFEKQLYKGAAENNQNLDILNISTQINTIKGPDFVHGDHVHTGETDPHIWCSPKQMLIAAQACYESLVKIYPKQEAFFTKNFQQLKTEIADLDQLAKKQFAHCTARTFLIFHPTLTYFANDYDLTQKPIEINGKEPSIKQVQTIIETARRLNIKHIFVQKEFKMKSIDNIANEFGGSTIEIDPLNKKWAIEMKNTIMQLKFALESSSK